jgi:hypothetical protein
MRMRVLFSAVTSIAFLFTVTTQDLRAAEVGIPASSDKFHTADSTDLHAAVQASSDEVAAARKSVQNFLARSEVQDRIEQMRLDPAMIGSRVSQLSDSEILRLQAQVMAADEQIRTAGISNGIIALIVIGVIVVVVLIIFGQLIDD